MSVLRLKELLREMGRDDRMTLEEVKGLIDASSDEEAVTPGELMMLQATLQAHAQQLTPEAYQALAEFVESRKR